MARDPSKPDALWCPSCGQYATEKVHVGESRELAAGPPIRVCHSSEGAYIHVYEEG